MQQQQQIHTYFKTPGHCPDLKIQKLIRLYPSSAEDITCKKTLINWKYSQRIFTVKPILGATSIKQAAYIKHAFILHFLKRANTMKLPVLSKHLS